jgi:RNA polymerase sigma-70 factor (ECF subfamily)
VVRSIGDNQTFEETYVELFVRAQRVAARILGDRTEAEDVAAETMVKAMGSWPRMRTYCAPWVTRVATNLAIDIVRRREAAPDDQLAAAVNVDGTDRMALLGGLRTLPARQRQALVLRYVVDLSASDTAEVMGLSAGTVKTHLQRGLAALRLQFGDEFKEKTDVT